MRLVVEHSEYDGSGGVRVNLHLADLGDAKARQVAALFKDADEASKDGRFSPRELIDLTTDLYQALRS